MGATKKLKGFTIIEVVLVLAIAGLIFLMVFIALPALQRAQRDMQRKDDISRMSAQLTSYSSNNRGNLPQSLITTSGNPARSFVQNYLGGASANTSGVEYEDPQTGAYTFAAANATIPTTPAIGVVYYNIGFVCGVDGAVVTGTARQFALRMFLENQTVPYCLDNI